MYFCVPKQKQVLHAACYETGHGIDTQEQKISAITAKRCSGHTTIPLNSCHLKIKLTKCHEFFQILTIKAFQHENICVLSKCKAFAWKL